MKKIGFIGCGNMGKAMVCGILKSGLADGAHMAVSNRHPDKLKDLKEQYGVAVYTDNKEVAKRSELLVLAVKPELFAEVIAEIRAVVDPSTIVIGIAAGVSMAAMRAMFDRDVKLAKGIPNTPALVQEAMSGVAYGENLSEADRLAVQALFESFGKCCEVKESMMEAVTVVSGSSPAYLYMILEAMADGAVLEGMNRKDAYEFAAQTMLGSARMLLESGLHPGELKDMVCSPGGTTIEAVAKLEEKGVRSAIMEAMRTCADKSRKMSKR